MSKQKISITPTIPVFYESRASRPLTAISGANNTGKSLILKYLKQHLGKSAYLIGPNRFYHVYHFSSGVTNPNEIDEFENQFRQSFAQEQHNHENNFLDLNRIITGLKNSRRKQLFELCGDLLSCKITMRKVDEDNDLSVQYIDMDGQNISLGSTGTRLLLTILGICMDDRFKTILIDEPELGLGPKVQQSLATFLSDPEERVRYFPHLENVFIATHSHIFLNKNDLQSNFVVSKKFDEVSLTQVSNVSEFHRLQFNLLGNSLESLFLPSAIIVVEGKTDSEYIERLMAIRFPDKRISVGSSEGDTKRKVRGLKDAFGELARSPLRNRIFVVVDSVHSIGLSAGLVDMGILKGNIIIWDKNGIEFVYPESIMRSIYSCAADHLLNIEIKDDVVSLNGISRKKNELKEEVLARITKETELPGEVEEKLMLLIKNSIE